MFCCNIRHPEPSPDPLFSLYTTRFLFFSVDCIFIYIYINSIYPLNRPYFPPQLEVDRLDVSSLIPLLKLFINPVSFTLLPAIPIIESR